MPVAWQMMLLPHFCRRTRGSGGFWPYIAYSLQHVHFPEFLNFIFHCLSQQFWQISCLLHLVCSTAFSRRHLRCVFVLSPRVLARVLNPTLWINSPLSNLIFHYPSSSTLRIQTATPSSATAHSPALWGLVPFFPHQMHYVLGWAIL